MRKINYKKISILMIMFLAFSIFIMPTNVNAERINMSRYYPAINSNYKEYSPRQSDKVYLSTFPTLLIRTTEDLRTNSANINSNAFYCVEKDKISPPHNRLGNQSGSYVSYEPVEVENATNANLKTKKENISKVLSVGYPFKSLGSFNSELNPNDVVGLVSAVEYEKATQFALWAIMEKDNLDDAIVYVDNQKPYKIITSGMDESYMENINERVLNFASKILKDAKKSNVNTSSGDISLDKETSKLQISQEKYKVYGPYTIKNNSSSVQQINLKADTTNSSYTFEILENKNEALGNTNVTKSIAAKDSFEFYIKVTAKENVNINYQGKVDNVVTASWKNGEKIGFVVYEPKNAVGQNYAFYTAAGDNTVSKYEDNDAYPAGAIQVSAMQSLIKPIKYKEDYSETISLSWDRSVGNIIINKLDDLGNALSGATFTISTTENVNWKTVVDSKKITGIKAGTTPTYSEDYKTITFVAESTITITDVPFGIYRVAEITSPTGYYTEIKEEDKSIVISTDKPNEERAFTNYKVVVDLGLEKWVSKVVGKTSSGEERAIPYNKNTFDNKVEGRTGDIYVCEGDIVTYTIRIFNHGNVNATATKIIDKVPEGLEFLPNNETNKKYGWEKANDGSLYTEYLSSQDLIQKHCDTGTAHDGLNYNSDANKNVAQSCEECKYQDVQISFKVSFIAKDGSTLKRLINVAEIAEYKSEYEEKWVEKPVDVDSSVSNHPTKHDFEATNTNRVAYKNPTQTSKYYREDDEDIAVIIPARFDLALEKWVSQVIREDEDDRNYEDHNILDNNVEERAGDIKVRKGDIVVYTIRVYNQGNMSGYATEIMDSLPEGLEFLPDNSINKIYGWEEKEGKLYTTTLNQTLLKAHSGWAEHLGYNYNKGVNEAKSCEACDYRDIKIAFKVGETVTENKQNIDRIINFAQITKASTIIPDRNVNYADIDSVPGNYLTDFEEGKTREDDEDIAVIVPEKFDLALQKWITSYTKTVGDQEQVVTTEQNHETTVQEKNNSKLVKIDLEEKGLSKTTIKIKYAVRVENEGEIPGYVKELTDYIPAGTEFHEEDNLNEEGKPYWTLDGNKAITAKAYEEQLNTILQPGEAHTFYITLRWVNDRNNLGLKNNWVEISKDSNNWEVPDVDSDPENMLEERTPHYWEDEEDEVPFLLTIKTGESVIKFALIFVILAVALSGAILIRRKVRNII